MKKEIKPHILSIIIPYYNAEDYIEELLDRLEPQITPAVEVVLVDDGSKKPFKTKRKWLTVIRQENKGLAGARNTGLEATDSWVVAFIDADDLVAVDYVEEILEKTETERWDYLDLSWRSLEDLRFNYLLRSSHDKLTNPSVCTRVFKREFIGSLRFNEHKDVAEDEDFTRRLMLERGKRANVTNKYMYFYRTQTPGSLSKQYRAGKTKTKRIVYYLPIVTAQDFILLDEVKKESQENEVVVMTHDNKLAELALYAQVIKPIQTWATEARGIQTKLIKEKEQPMKAQIVIYTSKTYEIGGIESFIYNFCSIMNKHYDILVLYDQMDPSQIARLTPLVPVMRNGGNQEIECDTLIINRVFDKIPSNIKFKKSIQMVHGCKAANPWHIPTDKGQVVCVSEAVRESFGEEAAEAQVIKNLVNPKKTKDMLLLVSATRLDTNEKGQERMLQLAQLMKRQGVPFIWLYFSNAALKDAPENMIRMQPTQNIAPYMRKADYLVQLSDTEAFCYSMVESLQEGTPVITTPLPVLAEIGVKDGENARVVPFELTDYDTRQLLEVPKFKYSYNNGLIVSKWKKLLGNTKPTESYYKPAEMLTVEIIKQYNDMQIGQTLKVGERWMMQKERAKAVEAAGFGVITED